MQPSVSMTEILREPSLASNDSRPIKHQKRVRFDATAVDNEYKMRSRQKRAPLVAIAPFSQKIEISHSSRSSRSSTRETAANISRKVDSPHSWSLPAQSRETKRQYRETNLRLSSQPSWTFYPLPQDRSPVPRTASTGSGVSSTSVNGTSARRAANSTEKREKASRGRTTSDVLPRVPDAPSSQTQRPPPTPRPARLPTPELMDIDGEMFCACESNLYGKGYVSAELGVFAKMDSQLEAAKAHMKRDV